MTRYPNQNSGINDSLLSFIKGECMARNRGEKLLRYEGVRLAGIYSQSFSLVKSNRTNAQLQENVLGLSADFNPRTMQCWRRFTLMIK